MEECRKAMEDQIAMAGKKTIIIGGDMNANVGRGRERAGVHGQWGTGRMNDACRDLMDWCEAHGMAYVNSHVAHPNRGAYNRMSYDEKDKLG